MTAVTEVTLLDIVDPAHAINAAGDEPLKVRTARITDHADDAGGDNPEDHAIFYRNAHGHPWIKKAGVLRQTVSKPGEAAADTDAVIFVNFDYSMFE